jgi:hypothetical protein
VGNSKRSIAIELDSYCPFCPSDEDGLTIRKGKENGWKEQRKNYNEKDSIEKGMTSLFQGFYKKNGSIYSIDPFELSSYPIILL